MNTERIDTQRAITVITKDIDEEMILATALERIIRKRIVEANPFETGCLHGYYHEGRIEAVYWFDTLITAVYDDIAIVNHSDTVIKAIDDHEDTRRYDRYMQRLIDDGYRDITAIPMNLK